MNLSEDASAFSHRFAAGPSGVSLQIRVAQSRSLWPPELGKMRIRTYRVFCLLVLFVLVMFFLFFVCLLFCFVFTFEAVRLLWRGFCLLKLAALCVFPPNSENTI